MYVCLRNFALAARLLPDYALAQWCSELFRVCALPRVIHIRMQMRPVHAGRTEPAVAAGPGDGATSAPRPISLAIVGRPNVGKVFDLFCSWVEWLKGITRLSLYALSPARPCLVQSSLINALVREEVAVTGPQPGVTRDAVELSWSFGDTPITLVDTAGVRKPAKVGGWILLRVTE